MTPPAKRPKQGKGRGGKQRDRSQVPQLTEVPTRLETVVKLSGSTCYRAMVIQDVDFFQDGGIVESNRQQSDTQLRTAAVKRREAFTRANVGLFRAIGTTIIVSPLDMAGQPGACIVTAVLQAGFAIVDTTAYGEAEIQTALEKTNNQKQANKHTNQTKQKHDQTTTKQKPFAASETGETGETKSAQDR